MSPEHEDAIRKAIGQGLVVRDGRKVYFEGLPSVVTAASLHVY